MENPRIYLNDLGYRNPVTEKEQIIWYFEQYAKRYNLKSHVTRYWLNLLEYNEKYLLKCECFELIKFLKDHVTAEQIHNRQVLRMQNIMQDELELTTAQEWQRKYQKEQLLKVNPN